MAVAFVDGLARFGDAPVLSFGDGEALSYRTLSERVEALAATLGPRRGLHLIAAEPTADFIVTYLATLRAGWAAMLVAAETEMQPLLAVFQPERVTERVGRKWLTRSATGGLPCHPDLALLLSTSGSTGGQKFVRLSGDNLQANADAIVQSLGLSPSDRGLLSLPLHYSYGLSVLHSHLSAGASVYVAGESPIAPGFVDRVTAAGCTNISGVPYSYELFERAGFRERVLPGLRFMTVAGGRMPPDLARTYDAHMRKQGGRFFAMYGQTEATARIAILPPEQLQENADCIGNAIPGGALSLMDGEGRPIAEPMTAGELVYRGPNVMMGYATTRAVLTTGKVVEDLRTGDLAERLPSGIYRIVGRLNRFSKIGGLRLGHEEIERRLAALGHDAHVTGDDERIVAVVADRGLAVRDRVAGALATITHLPAHHLAVKALENLPRGTSGKIDYPALRAIAFADAAPKKTPSVRPVEAAFAAAFPFARLSPHDTFVSLGGDSLTYVQLSLSLESVCGQLPKGWECRSIASLSAPAERPVATVGWLDVRHWPSVDTDILLRAVAVLLVVVHHATFWPMPGGAAVLLMLIGYSLARFQRDRLFSGRNFEILGPVARNVALYYVILVIYCAIDGRFPWQSMLLLGNLAIDSYSTAGTALIVYWFIEAYAQLMLVLAVLFAVPAVRRAVADWPMASGLLVVCSGIASRYVTPLAWDEVGWKLGDMRPFVTTMVFYLPAFGWCIYFADTAVKKVWLTAAAIAVFLIVLSMSSTLATALWIRTGIALTGAIGLIWLSHIRLPRLLARGAAIVASASFAIYLLHNVPAMLGLDDLEMSLWLRVPLQIAAGLGLALSVHFGARHLKTLEPWRATVRSMPERRRGFPADPVGS